MKWYGMISNKPANTVKDVRFHSVYPRHTVRE